MQYLNNDILCLEYDELVPALVSVSNYKYHKKEGNFNVHGIGGNGRQVFIEFESLPSKYRKAVINKYGDPYQYILKQPILNSLVWDAKAQGYYEGYELPNGDKLPNSGTDLRGKAQINYVERYTESASWLNMLDRLTTDKQALKRELNISIAQFWATASELIKIKNVKLPADKVGKRLKQKLKAYMTLPVPERYEYLIETHKFGNSHSAKVKDEVAESLLKELIAHPNNHDDTIIAKAYNAWAKENKRQAITAGTVGYRRKQWKNELMLEREGIAKVAAKLSKKIARERASSPLLLLNSDDNILDAFFVNGESKWFRPALYVVIDTYNDYILGYAWGNTITKELIKEAFRNANNHIKQITNEANQAFGWHQLQTDRWGISGKNTTELEQFYNTLSTFTPAGLKNASSKYIEASFGTVWHQMLKICFPDNYSGHNVGSKKEINRELLSPNNFPDISEADEMIERFIWAMRNTTRKDSKLTRHQEWLQAFHSSEKSQQKALSRAQELQIFGREHHYENTITDNGVMPTIGGVRIQYELSQAELLQHIGKKVKVIYDENDLSQVLITDGKGLRQLVTAFDKVPGAFADYEEGDAERIKALQAEKKTLLPIIQKSIEQRKAILERERIDAESRIKAGVLTKEISHQDQRLLSGNRTEKVVVLQEKATETRGVRAENDTKESFKKPFKVFKQAKNSYYDEY